MTQLPTAYIAELFDAEPSDLRDGMSFRALVELIERMNLDEVRSPAVPSLLGGELLLDDHQRGALLVLGDCRLNAVADWVRALNLQGFTSLVGCSCAQVATDGYLRADDAPILLGHGVVMASRGVTGRPLVGMALAELRRELSESRERLSAVAGYRIGILMPAVSTFGHAVDGLVLEEARRAGYHLVLEPGGGVTDLDDASNKARANVLDYRIVSTDDTPERLASWIVGAGLTRQAAQVRELLQRPRRILSRLKLQ
jgi:hypothetical protein